MMDATTVGVVGLGLLGRGIAATLAAHGFRVTAYDPSPKAREAAGAHVRETLEDMVEHGRITEGQARRGNASLRIVSRVDPIGGCGFVIESVVEDVGIKTAVFDELERLLPSSAVIATNTSALPITPIQEHRKHPGRFVGMHWGEPCHISRFLEVIRGGQTTDATFDAAVELGYACGKEPSLIHKDIRGFITNRLMYAMIREALHLLESGVADVDTIDRSFRNDIGFWATIAGPFRWMDLTGISSYTYVMKDLLPELSNSTELPETMRQMIETGAEGVSNSRGFYDYDPESARQWMRTWTEFTWKIRELSDQYVPAKAPELIG